MTTEGTKVNLEPLLALARSHNSRSRYRRMRELLPGIEAAREAGTSHAAILETLRSDYELDIEPGTYTVYLARLRASARARSCLVPSPSSQPRPSPSLSTTRAAVTEAANPAAISKETLAPSPHKPPGVSPAAWTAMQAAENRSRKR